METGKAHSLTVGVAYKRLSNLSKFTDQFSLIYGINSLSFSFNSIKITTSCYPVPSICCHDLVYDWFESLAQCLHWNVRKGQARLDVSDSSDTEN